MRVAKLIICSYPAFGATTPLLTLLAACLQLEGPNAQILAEKDSERNQGGVFVTTNESVDFWTFW